MSNASASLWLAACQSQLRAERGQERWALVATAWHLLAQVSGEFPRDRAIYLEMERLANEKSWQRNGRPTCKIR